LYPKQKSECYTNFGGIDVKSSQYVTDITEFLNLKNVDFRVVGSLSSDSGSTAYTTVNSTLPILGVADYFSQSLSTGSTDYIFGGTVTIVGVDQQNVCDCTGGTFLPLMHSRVTGGVLNPTSFVLANSLYGCNGIDAWTYQGSTVAWQFSLGKPFIRSANPSPQYNAGTSLVGSLSVYYALLRQDGFYGPVNTAGFSTTGSNSIFFYPASGPDLNIALTGNPGSPLSPANVSFGSFGLSGIQMWLQFNNGPIYAKTSLLGITTGQPLGVSFAADYATNGWSINAAIPNPSDFQGAFVYGLGSTQGSDNSQALGSNPNVQEYFYNQLFSAGFGSSFRSRVIFSNAGTPEQADYRNFFDVAPNDPNGVSAMKAYFTQLAIFKPDSSWALSGTGPETFSLSQVSPIYGCIAKRAACVWNQKLWFLDKQGICEWNGANTSVISTKVQTFFERMNVSVAALSAIMVHVKERNEVWTAIPIDGSSFNNIIIIYDYVAQAWRTRTCPPGNLTEMNVLSLGSAKPKNYFGTYSGMIGTFGNSFIGDNGAGFTSVIKTGFQSEMGNSVTKMFRRLFVDATVPAGQTQAIQVNFYADHSTTAAYQTTMVISNTPSQQRIDFGIPGKSLSVEFIYNGNGGFLQLNGYTIEFRFQRSV
jgi:hypothetical protein